jgi:hypothetical protein
MTIEIGVKTAICQQALYKLRVIKRNATDSDMPAVVRLGSAKSRRKLIQQ